MVDLIAICDNEEKTRRLLSEYVKKHYAEKRQMFQIKEFETGEQLLNTQEHFHLILLDIEMDNMNGIEAAREIRKTDKDVAIIIISGYPKYKHLAYSLHVFDYIDKPFTEPIILHALKEFDLYRKKDHKEYIAFKTMQGMIKICTHDIYYLEYKDRKVFLYTTQHEYTLATPLSQIYDNLKTYGFYSPHRAFIVNFFYVKSYQKSELIMDDTDHTVIPIAKSKTKEFKEEFNRYLRNAVKMI